MTTKGLECFVEIVRCRNFNKAAENLYMSQSTISYQIKLLEEELGFPLFDAENRTQLTPAGRLIFNKAVRYLDEWGKSVDEARAVFCQDRQILHIGLRRLMDDDKLGEVLHRFYQEQSQYGFILHTYRIGYFISDLLHGVRDILFADSTEVQGAQELAYLPLCKSCWGYAIHKNHPLAKKERISFSDLNGQHIMLPDIPLGMDESKQALDIKKYSHPANISYSDCHENAVLCAAAGLFISSINYSIPSTHENVVFRPAVGYENQTLGLAWKKSDTRPSIRIFAKIAEDVFSQQ